MAVSTAFGWLGRRRAVPLVAALGVGVLALGFAAAQWRTVAVQTPVLDHRLGPTNVAGRVVGVEVLPGASRVTLERLRIGQLSPARTPERLRVRLGGKQPRIIPGDWIRVRAILSPPPPPAAPGAFDFQRQSYFRQLGAVGFSLGSATVEEHHRAEGFAAFGFALERLRQRISERVVAGIDGTPGAIAAALMTGSRGAISAEVMANIRDSGLAHLLAISGLHIGLVAGIVFFGLRGALALVPPLALRYPIKKWAAMAAIAGAFAYALVAGATVPTQRAFLMIGLVLLAVLFDRRGLSMRLVAWAAFAILLFRPESLLGASFQMSFAAVVALIAVYEVVRDRRRLDEAGPPSWPRRALHYLGGVGLTTLIAGSATAPFAIYHFNRFAVFGLAANLVAVPVTALWIMPWAVAAFLLMPFGLESVALAPMGLGIEVVVRVAETVAAWPGAVTLVPAMPVWGLAALGLGAGRRRCRSGRGGRYGSAGRPCGRRRSLDGRALGLGHLRRLDATDGALQPRGMAAPGRPGCGGSALAAPGLQRRRPLGLRPPGLHPARQETRGGPRLTPPKPGRGLLDRRCGRQRRPGARSLPGGRPLRSVAPRRPRAVASGQRSGKGGKRQ